MEVRIDKWLWAARIFKTRSIAVDACKNGKVMIDGIKLKPSHVIKEGDIVQVKKAPIIYSFKVIQVIQNRVSAKLIPEILENVTPKEQLEILEMHKMSGFINRAKGTGRPTKKERRALDEFIQPEFFSDFEFDFDDDGDEDN